MTIQELKKKLGLKNPDIADMFDISADTYATSSAKSRYDNALIRFYKKVREVDKENESKINEEL